MSTELIKLLNDFWALIVFVIGSIGGFFTYLSKRKSSTNLLYKQLENLKIQVIAQVQRELSLTKEISKKQKILNELKINCPECYDKVLKRLENDFN